jgi:NSS family neurotransmitter:Na+ symporter
MIAYASYLGSDDSLPADGGAIVVINTLVALLAGFVVFPVLFANGIEPASGGIQTTFVSLAGAFSQLPAGALLGATFFVVLLVAALSSAISLLETPTSYVVENSDYGRKTVATALGAGIFALGVPTALDTGILGWYNDIVFSLMLPLAVLLFALFVGWVAADDAFDEMGQGSRLGDGFTTLWLWWVRVVIPVGIGLTLLLGVQDLLVKAGILEQAVILA